MRLGCCRCHPAENCTRVLLARCRLAVATAQRKCHICISKRKSREHTHLTYRKHIHAYVHNIHVHVQAAQRPRDAQLGTIHTDKRSVEQIDGNHPRES